MQSVRRQPENHISNSDLASIDDLAAIDHADDATRQIVFAAAIHSRHLRCLATDQRAVGRATGLAESAQQLRENARLQFFCADVIEKKSGRAPRTAMSLTQ